jgi:hypothetical protein
MNYFILYTVAFLLNVPFGFFRKPLSQKASSRTIKFLIMMLLIHVPIPAIIYLRIKLGLDKSFIIIAPSIIICILGQMFGSRIVPKLIPSRQNS